MESSGAEKAEKALEDAVAAANGRRFADVRRACADALGRADFTGENAVSVLRRIAREVGARPPEGALERLEPERFGKVLFSGEGCENQPENRFLGQKIEEGQKIEKVGKIENKAGVRRLLFGSGFAAALGELVENFRLQDSAVARELGLRPQSALVYGPSGVGKTQLVYEACRALPHLAAFRVDSTQVYS